MRPSERRPAKCLGAVVLQNGFCQSQITFKVHENEEKCITPQSDNASCGQGLRIFFYFDNIGNILGYTILKSSETPGLGAKASVWFQKNGKGNIIGMNPKNKPLTVSKDGGDVDAITASTITSRAFLKAINQAYAVYAKKK